MVKRLTPEGLPKSTGSTQEAVALSLWTEKLSGTLNLNTNKKL